MTAAAFRKIALALPEAVEAPHFERTSFRVNKKILHHDRRRQRGDGAGGAARAPLRPPEDYADVFFSYGGWTERNGALGIHLAKADATLLRELVADAWRAIAPKRLTRA